MLDPEPDRAKTRADARVLRQFAAIWTLFFLAGTGWYWLYRHRTAMAVACAVLALTLGPVGFVRPARLMPIFMAAMAVATPIGWAITRLVTLLLFFGLFTPVGWLMRARGWDPLVRRRRAGVPTYWKPFPSARSVKSYFRQSS